MAEIVDQPTPRPTTLTPIVDLVVADLAERKQVGIERYGMPLTAHNGRDALVDAYQEAVDLVLYLRQALEERSGAPVVDDSDLRYPEGRPRWLGEYQPWPCGRCGRQVDEHEQHKCVPPTEGADHG